MGNGSLDNASEQIFLGFMEILGHHSPDLTVLIPQRVVYLRLAQTPQMLTAASGLPVKLYSSMMLSLSSQRPIFQF